MVDNIEYGKNSKRIIFTDTDHRHAQLTLKLKDDGMTQAKFFRNLITGYLEDDERIRDYVVNAGNLSKQKKQRNIKLRETGKQITQDLGLSNDQVDNIFDLISEEFPDL
tara:strand:+ start:5460 stop:5786 length:327 start_codon:yes stop_codon:yes gene_type:complete